MRLALDLAEDDPASPLTSLVLDALDATLPHEVRMYRYVYHHTYSYKCYQTILLHQVALPLRADVAYTLDYLATEGVEGKKLSRYVHQSLYRS